MADAEMVLIGSATSPFVRKVGIGKAVALSVQETWRGEGGRSNAWTRRQSARIERGIRALAADLQAVLLDGNLATVGAIAAACALGFLSFRFPQAGWRSALPELADWRGKSDDDPAFAATAPMLRPGVEFSRL